jgi:hypothetical protein
VVWADKPLSSNGHVHQCMAVWPSVLTAGMLTVGVYFVIA